MQRRACEGRPRFSWVTRGVKSMSRVGGTAAACSSPAYPPDDDVLDAEAVERLDDLERVEAPGLQPGTLVLFRARRATDKNAHPSRQ